jgi:hypothetical protein
MPAAQVLPDVSGYVPADAHVRAQLAELLSPPTVEESVLESFRPPLKHRQLLTPAGLFQAAKTCREELQAAVEKEPRAAEAEKIQNLLTLLKQKQDLAELLIQLRQLLQQA